MFRKLLSKLPNDEITGTGSDAPYMRRFYLWKNRWGIGRFHEILRSDSDRDFHDHPWDFMSIMLRGSYTEHTPDGSKTFSAPTLLFRKAEDLHRLELNTPTVWTFVVTRPWQRHWGFQTADGWVPWRVYFIRQERKQRAEVQ